MLSKERNFWNSSDKVSKTLFFKAIAFAREVHRGQRYSSFPKMKHIMDVVKVALNHLKYPVGYHGDDYTLLCVAALHDTVEDGDDKETISKYILETFGERISQAVQAITDEAAKNRKERKILTLPKTKANHDARIVKVCDIFANSTFSKTMGSDGLFSMYLKEYSFVRSQLISSDENTAELWKMLDNLMEYEK